MILIVMITLMIKIQTTYNSLKHYLNNTSKYFVSHNQFQLLSGQYYISDDLIFKDIKNFSLIGIDQCVITCTSPASVLIINVTSFVFQNIKLMNCIRSQKEYFNGSQTHFDSIYAKDTVPFSEITQYYTSMFLRNCSSVNIIDTDTIATVMTSFTAILIVNIQDESKIINIKVQINAVSCTIYNYTVRISGIVVYFSDGIAKESKLILGNFYYYNSNSYESCRNHFHCIINLIFLENDRECQKFPLNLKIFIRDSVFSSLKNSSIICYYGEAHIDKHYNFVRNMSVIIENSTISNNIGHHNLSMFYIALKSKFITCTLNQFMVYKKS